MILIFFSSAQSDPAPLLTENVWDKLLHGAGYGVLALLYVFALAHGRRSPLQIAVVAVVLTSAYAASDELHQRFTPGRNADVRDWFADTVGGTVAAAGFVVSTASRQRHPLRR